MPSVVGVIQCGSRVGAVTFLKSDADVIVVAFDAREKERVRFLVIYWHWRIVTEENRNTRRSNFCEKRL